jgi:hypothetical protein
LTLPGLEPRPLSRPTRSLYIRIYRNLKSSPNIIRMIKSRRMRWTEHVARMGGRGMNIGCVVVNPEGKRPLERP